MERQSPRTSALLGALAALIPLVIVGPWFDAYALHGVTATWWQTGPGDQRVLVATTIERRTEFPNVQRPLARYRHNWPFSVLEPPRELPHLDATLSARIHVPAELDGAMLRARSPNRVAIRIDGSPLPPDGVGAGWHRLDVDWTGELSRSTALTLEWGRSEDTLTPIPRERLLPIEGDWTALRMSGWLALVVFASLLGAQLYRISRAPTQSDRRARTGALATALILSLGTGLRLFDFDVMPDYRENGDELFAMWNGWSLLHDGTPRGWSLWFDVYRGVADIQRIDEFGHVWHIVTPYFEHPPLFHLLTGVACHLGGAEDWRHCRIDHARVVPILLAALTTLLIIAVTRRLEPRGPTPWLAALVYSTIPMIAVQTRAVKEDALVTPMALATIWLFLRWRDSGRRRRDLLAAAACAGFATLAKVPGFALVPALVMLVAAEKDRRAAITAGVVGVVCASSFFAYGAIIDWDTFVVTLQGQAGRAVHFNIFLRWFDDGLINTNLVGRGWVMFLWLATMATVLARPGRETAVLTVPLVLYMCAISIGSGNWTYGWYAMPMQPFLCIGAGRFLADTWERPTLMRGAIFTLVFVFYSLNFTVDPNWAREQEALPVLRRVVSLAVAGLLAPYCLYQVWPNAEWKRLARLSLAAGLITTVVVAFLFVARYDVYYELYRNFDREVYFDR